MKRYQAGLNKGKTKQLVGTPGGYYSTAEETSRSCGIVEYPGNLHREYYVTSQNTLSVNTKINGQWDDTVGFKRREYFFFYKEAGDRQ